MGSTPIRATKKLLDLFRIAKMVIALATQALPALATHGVAFSFLALNNIMLTETEIIELDNLQKIADNLSAQLKKHIEWYREGKIDKETFVYYFRSIISINESRIIGSFNRMGVKWNIEKPED